MQVGGFLVENAIEPLLTDPVQFCLLYYNRYQADTAIEPVEYEREVTLYHSTFGRTVESIATGLSAAK